jgi:hypothetical protein
MPVLPDEGVGWPVLPSTWDIFHMPGVLPAFSPFTHLVGLRGQGHHPHLMGQEAEEWVQCQDPHQCLQTTGFHCVAHTGRGVRRTTGTIGRSCPVDPKAGVTGLWTMGWGSWGTRMTTLWNSGKEGKEKRMVQH